MWPVWPSSALPELGCQRPARRRRPGRPTQLRAHFFGNEMRIYAVANDLRSNEDDKLGSGQPIGAVRRKGVAERMRQLVEEWDAAAAAFLPFADQSCQKYGLAACDGYRALDPALGNGRRKGCAGRRRGNVADFLL